MPISGKATCCKRRKRAGAPWRGWSRLSRRRAAGGHSSHGDLYRAIDRLAKELGDDRIQNLFRSASALHQNFYEGYMPEGAVASGLKDVEEITTLLAAFVD